MTLHEVAEGLRLIAYNLDQTNEKWSENDLHVMELRRENERLTVKLAFAANELSTAKARLLKLASKKAKRRPAKKARR